jgi:DNA-directed RNA polymerase specialized sigma24 family protein
VRGEAILGDDGFVVGLKGYFRKHRDVPEIPKGQRYVSRPDLDRLFTDKILKARATRDRKITEAVEEYGYAQREVADHLGLHFSTVSRIMRGKGRTSKK